MKATHLVVAVVAAFAACLLVPFAGSAAGPPDVVCPQDTFGVHGHGARPDRSRRTATAP